MRVLPIVGGMLLASALCVALGSRGPKPPWRPAWTRLPRQLARADE